MIIELSKYYEISTDELLGMQMPYTKDLNEAISNKLCSSDHKEAILNAFGNALTVNNAMCKRTIGEEEATLSDLGIFPDIDPLISTTQISMSSSYYGLAVNRNDLNISVMLLRNAEGFSWMKDPEKQKRITGLFELLSDAATLSICHFINSPSCSESFTSEYVSKATKIAEDKCKSILDRLCSVSNLSKKEAHLREGIISVYMTRGDGKLLSIISLAYEQMNRPLIHDYNIRGVCKMTGD